MGKNVSSEIKDNYDFYTNLLKERKSIFEKVVEISTISSNNNNYLEQNSTLKHISINDEMILIVQVKIANYKYFHFKLKCNKLTASPFFRYDSDGPTHRNQDENIPLSQQQVTTPHFHNHTKEGKSFAYKTDKLLDEAEKKALEDISLCIAHFCDESNIRLNKDEYPEIDIRYGLGLKEEYDDPLTNVKFDL